MSDSNQGQSQLDKFKQAAKELETDDDPERFKDKLGKLVKASPSEQDSKGRVRRGG